MNASLKCLLGGLAVALFSLSAAAQPGPGRQDMTGMGGMSGMSGMGGMGGMSGMSGMGGM